MIARNIFKLVPSTFFMFRDQQQWIDSSSHTLGGRVLAKVLGLVSAKETSGLNLGSRASGELLVEVDDTLHADSIRGGTESLYPRQKYRPCVFQVCCSKFPMVFSHVQSNPSCSPSKRNRNQTIMPNKAIPWSESTHGMGERERRGEERRGGLNEEARTEGEAT